MALKIQSLLERIGIGKNTSIGLAMSGGGAKGFSHIGVLMAFDRCGIKPDILSGVSAGSIATVLYSAGLSPKEIIQCFTDASHFADFTEWSIPKDGFLKLDRFGRLLEEWLPVRRLEELNIPTVVCATDLVRGKSVGWSKGEIVPRVIASCSIPIVFKPKVINGVQYVDGGVLRNLPAWAIRPYCGTLYGSNCSPLRPAHESCKTVLEIALRTYHLMNKSNVPQDMRLCDYVIQVKDVSDVSIFDLSSLRRGVMAGYEAAMRLLDPV